MNFVGLLRGLGLYGIITVTYLQSYLPCQLHPETYHLIPPSFPIYNSAQEGHMPRLRGGRKKEKISIIEIFLHKYRSSPGHFYSRFNISIKNFILFLPTLGWYNRSNRPLYMYLILNDSEDLSINAYDRYLTLIVDKKKLKVVLKSFCQCFSVQCSNVFQSIHMVLQRGILSSELIPVRKIKCE